MRIDEANTTREPKAEANDKRKKGQHASQPVLVGQFSRYSIQAFHTRFSAVCWFVTDAEQVDPLTGHLLVIGQEPTFDAAYRRAMAHQAKYTIDTIESAHKSAGESKIVFNA